MMKDEDHETRRKGRGTWHMAPRTLHKLHPGRSQSSLMGSRVVGVIGTEMEQLRSINGLNLQTTAAE